MGTTTRWTVSVSSEIDATVRAHLSRRGMGEGDLGRFVEDAVQWRIFDQTIAEARSGFEDLAGEELDALVNEALADARKTQ